MMDSTRFLTGQTLEEFVVTATTYQELWALGARRASVPADVVERLEALAAPVRLIALNEDWCLDAVGVVPYVSKLSEENPLIEFRNFSRDANLDLMDAHLTGTSRSIPVVVAYDAEWSELGWWGPRPAELQAWVMAEGAMMPKPERYHHMRQWYARDHGATTLREIAEMVLKALDAPISRAAVAAATAR